jgi:hypothetical protein
VYFSSSSSLIGCIFDANVSVRSFTADDPNGSFTLGPGYVDSFEIQVSTGLDITYAGSSQAVIFSQWSVLNDAPVVSIYANPGASSTAQIKIGQNQIGKLEIIGSTSATTQLYSDAGISVYPFKCYMLQIDYGTAQFVVASCNGAILGYPSNTSTSRAAVSMPVDAYKKLDAQFPASKPIVLFGGFYSRSGSYLYNYDLTWASDTQIHFRGASASSTLSVCPIPSGPGVPIAAKQAPAVFNYLGENISGGSVSSGGILVIDSTAIGLSGACPTNVYSVTSTPAGSVSGSFTRGVELGSTVGTSRYTYLQIPGSGASPAFTVYGDSTHQATLTGTSGATSQGYLAYTNVSSPTLTLYYTTVTNVNAVTTTGSQYVAYTADGNINGGNNTNWVFAPSQSGFLAFLM